MTSAAVRRKGRRSRVIKGMLTDGVLDVVRIAGGMTEGRDSHLRQRGRQMCGSHGRALRVVPIPTLGKRYKRSRHFCITDAKD